MGVDPCSLIQLIAANQRLCNQRASLDSHEASDFAVLATNTFHLGECPSWDWVHDFFMGFELGIEFLKQCFCMFARGFRGYVQNLLES